MRTGVCITDGSLCCKWRRVSHILMPHTRSLVFLSHSDDDDYDIDFYTVDPLPPEVHDTQNMALSPREQYEVYLYFETSPLFSSLCSDHVSPFWHVSS